MSDAPEHVDPYERATQCARAIAATKDPHRRAVLRNLQKAWIALANKESLLSAAEILKDAQQLDQLHAASFSLD